MSRFHRLIARPALTFFVAFLSAAPIVQSRAQAEADLPDKAPTDRSEYRGIVLENGLRVGLLSDPDLNKSSASMAVAVGSLADPEERQGLAHFLEHMLFLGTEKYPGEGEYGGYLRSNGGYSNAYTSSDLTNYHFEVSHPAFEGALDRFSQFFIAPLFTQEFTSREMNAVDSEFERNIDRDIWRVWRSQQIHFNPQHPINHFSTGNLSTLEGIERNEFVDFYERYYSANQMALGLAGAASLDDLERLARTYFSGITNRNVEPIRYSDDVLEQMAALRLIQVEPLQDLRQLQLQFPIPPTRDDYTSKPGAIVGFILGYEGTGSLLSYLKDQGLATGLSAGADDPTGDFSMFEITIELTEKGLADYASVLTSVFSAVEQLRTAPYPEYLFEERARMARLDYVYRDKGEGADRAVGIANNVLWYPIDLATQIDYLYTQPDPAAYFGVLGAMRPDNVLVTLVAKGVETDSQEQYLAVPYSYSEQSGAVYQSLTTPPIIEAIRLPEPNPYVPTAVSLLADQPVLLTDVPGTALYYSQDAEFDRPRVAMVIRVRQAASEATLRQSVLKEYYEAVLNEIVNEETYTARAAGLTLNLSASLDGITLRISGYNQSADRLLKHVVRQLRSADISDDRFAAIKDRIVRRLENANLAEAYVQSREYAWQLLREVYFRPSEMLSTAVDVTLADVQAFARTVFERGKIEAVVHGNVSADDAREAVAFVRENLGIEPVADENLYERRQVVLDPPTTVTAVRMLDVSNSCYWSEYVLGDDSPVNRAAALVIANFMEEPFYSEMRTRQQLGYIVGSFAVPRDDMLVAGFVIQSADYGADDLQKRAETFLQELPDMFSALSDSAFSTIVAAAKAEVAEKDKSVAERAFRYFGLAFDRDEDWDRQNETLSALDSLTKEAVGAKLSETLRPATGRRVTVLAFAADHEPAEGTVSSFDSVEEWKQGMTFR